LYFLFRENSFHERGIVRKVIVWPVVVGFQKLVKPESLRRLHFVELGAVNGKAATIGCHLPEGRLDGHSRYGGTLLLRCGIASVNQIC